ERPLPGAENVAASRVRSGPQLLVEVRERSTERSTFLLKTQLLHAFRKTQSPTLTSYYRRPPSPHPRDESPCFGQSRASQRSAIGPRLVDVQVFPLQKTS